MDDYIFTGEDELIDGEVQRVNFIRKLTLTES
jgi:hypothetical protein